MRTFRSKWIDPDFRRDPKTETYCEVCRRDLKVGQPHRFIMLELDRYEAIHPEDWEIAQQQIEATRSTVAKPWWIGKIGNDCAKRLGLEWSKQ